MWGYLSKAAEAIQKTIITIDEEFDHEETQQPQEEPARDVGPSTHIYTGLVDNMVIPIENTSPQGRESDPTRNMPKTSRDSYNSTDGSRGASSSSEKHTSSWFGSVATWVKAIKNDIKKQIGPKSSQFMRELESPIVDNLSEEDLYAYMLDVIDRIEEYSVPLVEEARSYRGHDIPVASICEYPQEILDTTDNSLDTRTNEVNENSEYESKMEGQGEDNNNNKVQKGIVVTGDTAVLTSGVTFEKLLEQLPEMRYCYREWDHGVNRPLCKMYEIINSKIIEVEEKQQKSHSSGLQEDLDSIYQWGRDSDGEENKEESYTPPRDEKAAFQTSSAIQEEQEPSKGNDKNEERKLMWSLLQKRIVAVRDESLDTMMSFLDFTQKLEENDFEEVRIMELEYAKTRQQEFVKIEEQMEKRRHCDDEHTNIAPHDEREVQDIDFLGNNTSTNQFHHEQIKNITNLINEELSLRTTILKEWREDFVEGTAESWCRELGQFLYQVREHMFEIQAEEATSRHDVYTQEEGQFSTVSTHLYAQTNLINHYNSIQQDLIEQAIIDAANIKLCMEDEREEAEQREREEAEQRDREEAEQREREEAAQRDREEAEQRDREEAEQRDREDAEQRDREEAEQRDREEAEQREREEAEQRDREEAEQRDREEAEQRDREEAEQRDREEAEQREREEAEQREREEAEQREREEAQQRDREEAQQRDREEAEQREREEAEQREREEAEQREREVAEQREREEAEQREREEAEQREREEAEQREREEAEQRERDHDQHREEDEQYVVVGLSPKQVHSPNLGDLAECIDYKSHSIAVEDTTNAPPHMSTFQRVLTCLQDYDESHFDVEELQKIKSYISVEEKSSRNLIIEEVKSERKYIKDLYKLSEEQLTFVLYIEPHKRNEIIVQEISIISSYETQFSEELRSIINTNMREGDDGETSHTNETTGNENSNEVVGSDALGWEKDDEEQWAEWS